MHFSLLILQSAATFTISAITEIKLKSLQSLKLKQLQSLKSQITKVRKLTYKKINLQMQMALNQIKSTEEELKGYRKTAKQAQSASFLCFLVYFTIKSIQFIYPQVCTLLVFYNFKNLLNENPALLSWFIVLLLANTYFTLTTGKNPGFEYRRITQKEQKLLVAQCRNSQSQKMLRRNQQMGQQMGIQVQQQQEMLQKGKDNLVDNESVMQRKQQTNLSLEVDLSPLPKISLQNYCKICNCLRRNRMKHCYGCNKCIMKFDHHCPWIGSCVGQLNHFKFQCCLFSHTLQSLTTFYVCIKSLTFYQYHDLINDTFSTEFGVFIIWSIMMFLYLMFAGGLMFFHSYLIFTNITTRQLMTKRKCAYLKNIKGNPFDQGLFNNLKGAMWPDQNGKQWCIGENKSQGNNPFSKIFKNQYYQCF